MRIEVCVCVFNDLLKYHEVALLFTGHMQGQFKLKMIKHNLG